jgi:hypothetical protein
MTYTRIDGVGIIKGELSDDDILRLNSFFGTEGQIRIFRDAKEVKVFHNVRYCSAFNTVDELISYHTLTDVMDT